MSFPAYPTYKESKHLWFDKIPFQWDSVNIRLIARRYSGGTPDKSNSLYWTDGTIPWLNSGEVNQGVITEPTTYISEDALAESSAKWIPPNSIIVALAGQGKTKGMAAITTFMTTCNQSMAAIVFETDHPKFMYWWLVSQYKNIRGMASDDARDGLNLEMIATIPCPRPPADEQQQIASFLDWKTGQIDALIAKKKELIEKLKEKRIAVITQAVTKGLNPDAPMRDSGIDWLGQTPEHWKCIRLRFVLRERFANGLFKKAVYWGEGNRIVNVSDLYVHNDLVDENQLERLECTSEELEGFSAEHGDFFIVRSSLKLEGIGKSATLMNPSEPTVFECHIVRGRPNLDEVHPRFLNLFLNSDYARQHFISQANAVTMATIDQEKLKCLVVTFPEYVEQQKIVEIVDYKLTTLDSMVLAAKTVIDRLTEYRTALITAATTGKIDVRNVKRRGQVAVEDMP